MLRKFVLLVLAATLTTAPVAATTTTIDTSHPLTDDAHIDTFEREGVTSADFAQVDLNVTVAEGSDAAGLDGFYLDTGNVYLRLDYDETVDRTIRFYIPSEYFAPRVQRTLEPTRGNTPISLTPVRDGEMTAVSIDVDGQTDSTYAISTAAGGIWSIRSSARERAENQTGWELPTLAGGSEQWQYIRAGSYSSSSPARINDTSATIQYETDAPDGTTQWLPVPACDDPSTQAVCSLEDQNATIIMSSQDSPRIRYKSSTDLLSDLGGAINDLRQTDDRAKDFFGSLFGGA